MRFSMLHAALASSLLLAACGGPLKFTPQPTPKAPEAEVKITADVKKEQGETKLAIAIDHLAKPERLADGGAHFVVWYRKNGDAPWTRIAALKYEEGSRTGSIDQASVPETGFELEVTVEHDVSPGSPSPNVVVAQRVN